VAAEPPARTCEFENDYYDRVQRTQTGRCTLSLQMTPEDPEPESEHKRTLIFGRDGGMLVVATLDITPAPGQPEPTLSQTIGSRAFYFFPRERALSNQFVDSLDILRVTLPNSELIRINTQNGRIESYSGGKISEAERISLQNKGGVEFTSAPRRGLRLDCGWRQGANPIEKTTSSCTFTDKNGATCAVSNAKIFNYTYSGRSLLDVQLKHSTDTELAAFLKTACPKLDPDWTAPPSNEVDGPCSTPEDQDRLRLIEELQGSLKPILSGVKPHAA
jgi:hypothetical protein